MKLMPYDEGKMLEVLNGLAEKYEDTKIYSKEEWADRNEKVGNGSTFTLICEGPLYELLNGYIPAGKDDMDVDRLNKVAKEHGFWWDRGFDWSYHFYRI
jgi:hypothetical protein